MVEEQYQFFNSVHVVYERSLLDFVPLISNCLIESFLFKLRMLHDTGMIHSRYIHNAF